jgi:hypothetical protein
MQMIKKLEHTQKVKTKFQTQRHRDQMVHWRRVFPEQALQAGA